MTTTTRQPLRRAIGHIHVLHRRAVPTSLDAPRHRRSCSLALRYAVSLFPFGIEDEKVRVCVEERLGRPNITHSECEDQRSKCKCGCEAPTGSLPFSHDFLPILPVKLASKDGRLVMWSGAAALVPRLRSPMWGNTALAPPRRCRASVTKAASAVCLSQASQPGSPDFMRRLLVLRV